MPGSQLLIGYKPEHQKACYITRMDKENVQGIDALLQEFQVRMGTLISEEKVPGQHGKHQH